MTDGKSIKSVLDKTPIVSSYFKEWGLRSTGNGREHTANELTGLWMKNMVTAPTMGTSPISGSKITLIIP